MTLKICSVVYTKVVHNLYFYNILIDEGGRIVSESKLLLENPDFADVRKIIQDKVPGVNFFDVVRGTILDVVNEELITLGYRSARKWELGTVAGQVRACLPRNKAIISTHKEDEYIEPDYSWVPGISWGTNSANTLGSIGFLAINDKMIVMAVKVQPVS